MAHHILTVSRLKLFETTIDNMPKVIPSALNHNINTFESESDHQSNGNLSGIWKMLSNSYNAKFAPKYIDGDQPFLVNRKP